MMLNLTDFTSLVTNGPLISIDLIIKNSVGEVLLGRRSNQPAQGYWFVPGGRVLKNGTIEQAIQRISLKEINQKKSFEEFSFVGVYEHFYSNSFVSKEISTHYVVLAFEIECDLLLSFLPSFEHSEYHYFQLNDVKNNELIHCNTKEYFQ